MLAWKVAGYYGVDRWLLPMLGTPWHPGAVDRPRTRRRRALGRLTPVGPDPLDRRPTAPHGPGAFSAGRSERGPGLGQRASRTCGDGRASRAHARRGPAAAIAAAGRAGADRARR